MNQEINISGIKKRLPNLEMGMDFFNFYSEEQHKSSLPIFVGHNFWGDVVYIQAKNKNEDLKTLLERVKIIFDFEAIDHCIFIRVVEGSSRHQLEVTCISNLGCWAEFYDLTRNENGLLVAGELISSSILPADSTLAHLVKNNAEYEESDFEFRAKLAEQFRTGTWLDEPFYQV